MTKLEPVPMKSGDPFLLAPEIVDNPSVRLIGEPFQEDTKFKEGQWVSAAEISKCLTEKEYNSMGLDQKDVAKRLENNTRKYYINATTFNYLVQEDQLGNDSKKWDGKTIELEALSQMTKDGRKEVIYAKGST